MPAASASHRHKLAFGCEQLARVHSRLPTPRRLLGPVRVNRRLVRRAVRNVPRRLPNPTMPRLPPGCQNPIGRLPPPQNQFHPRRPVYHKNRGAARPVTRRQRSMQRKPVRLGPETAPAVRAPRAPSALASVATPSLHLAPYARQPHRVARAYVSYAALPPRAGRRQPIAHGPVAHIGQSRPAAQDE